MQRLKSILKSSIFLYILGILFFIALYEIISFSTGQTFLPEFFMTLGSAFTLLGKATTYSALGYTLLRLLISFLISGTTGILLGTLAGYFPSLNKVLKPTITILRAFPTVALILLLIVFVPNASIWIDFLVLFPIIYQASQEGSQKITEQYHDLILLKGKWNRTNLVNVVVPLSMNYSLLGLVQSIGMGLKVQIMAETFSYRGNEIGLGQLIYSAYQQVDYFQMVSYVMISLIVVLILDGLMSLIKRRIESRIKK